MAKVIDKEKTLKEAQRIKALLLKSSKPDLGLSDSDITIKQDEDGYAEIIILKGRTVEYEPGVGAHVKNISLVIDKDFREYRNKGWTFTQPQGGSFSIGVPQEQLKESFSFRDFLASK